MSNWFRRSAQVAAALTVAGVLVAAIKLLSYLSLLLLPFAIMYLFGIVMYIAVRATWELYNGKG